MNLSKVMLSGALAIVLLSATSCKTPSNIAYFQDFSNNPKTVVNLQNKTITIKPTDKLYIGVKSKDQQISQLFNLVGGNSSASSSSVSKDAYYYTVVARVILISRFWVLCMWLTCRVSRWQKRLRSL